MRFACVMVLASSIFVGCSESDPPPLASYAALAAGAPGSSVVPPLPGRTARTVLHEEVNEAENLLFTEDGRLFVTGGEAIYEIHRAPDGTFHKTDHLDLDCLAEGIVSHAGYLYGVCTMQDGSLRALLVASELTANPVFRPIAELQTGSAPNGMAFDPEGRLYITLWLTNQILRVTFASPLEVARTEVWADGLSLVNGIKYSDHAMYVTTLEASLVSPFWRIPLSPDGRAGRPQLLYARALTVLDDIAPFEDGFVITDFLNGTLIFWDARRGAYAETPAQTFFGPTSLAQGQPPMFDASQLLVGEKGTLFVRDEAHGDLLSMYQLP